MKSFFCTIFLICTLGTRAQSTINLKQLDNKEEYENIHVQKIDTDSLSSTFVIWVKKDVRPHYHVFHEEKIYVLSGEGTMTIGGKTFDLEPGVFLNIPKGVIHAVVVQGDIPLKVISTQTPQFLGKDRVFIETEKDY